MPVKWEAGKRADWIVLLCWELSFFAEVAAVHLRFRSVYLHTKNTNF